MKKEEKELFLSIVQFNQNELNLKYSLNIIMNYQDVQNTCKSLLLTYFTYCHIVKHHLKIIIHLKIYTNN